MGEMKIEEDLGIQELKELDKKYLLHPTSSIKEQQEKGPAFIFTEGKGIYLKDITGHTILDALSAQWNVNIGHGREELGVVAKEQMAKLGFSTCYSTFSHVNVILLATKLAELAPGNLTTTFFTSGGSESNDTAFKLVRHYWMLKGQPEKKKIISRRRSYHGLALGSTTATGLSEYRNFTNSLVPDFYLVDQFSTKSLRELIESEGPETIAAFISEPVQGAGGVFLPPEGYFQEVRSICDEYGILFIADEVITGFGRTGKYFGIEHYGVTPDVMCIAKGITSGYAPLGGVMLSKQIHQDLIDLSTGTFFHGYTYSGHPVSCAVALKNLEIIERENLVENARVMGDHMLKGFQWLKGKHRIVGAVRGLGLLGAIEIVQDKTTNSRFDEPISPTIVNEALKRGLNFRGVTLEGLDTLVFAPPLIINEQQLNKMIDILDSILSTIESA